VNRSSIRFALPEKLLQLTDRLSDESRDHVLAIARLPERVPLRDFWQGPPVRISSGWKLTKGGHNAECELYTHELGWELQLLINGELHMSQLCRTTDDILDVQQYWKLQMRQKGWTAVRDRLNQI
jgi:hypothetical protein